MQFNRFSDAVFAIAITLLVIEIRVPSVHDGIANETDLLWAVAHLAPKFLGFLISFMLIGMYWTRHHTLFGYVMIHSPPRSRALQKPGQLLSRLFLL